MKPRIGVERDLIPAELEVTHGVAKLALQHSGVDAVGLAQRLFVDRLQLAQKPAAYVGSTLEILQGERR
jgi:hypothetical protein